VSGAYLVRGSLVRFRTDSNWMQHLTGRVGLVLEVRTVKDQWCQFVEWDCLVDGRVERGIHDTVGVDRIQGTTEDQDGTV